MARATAARTAAALAGLLLAAAGLAGCGAGEPARPAGTTSTAPATTAPASTAAAGQPRRVTLADAEQCPVTLPGSVGPRGSSPDDFFGWGASHGNGTLWVGGLWPHGVIEAGPEFVAEDGSVGMKFGWWRAASGKLRITGRRLDAPAPPARGIVPDGYGATGFQASGVEFPTEGCWEITGTLPTTSLRFVTFVIKKKP